MGSFLDALSRRVVVFDGAMGTSIQALDLTPEDFGGLDGCNEVLVRTRPEAIRDIHHAFLAVGCDAIETDTFGGMPWVLDEYGLADEDRKSTRLNSSHANISYAVFCLKKKKDSPPE